MRVTKRLNKPHPAIQAAREHYQHPYYPYDVMLWSPRGRIVVASPELSL